MASLVVADQSQLPRIRLNEVKTLLLLIRVLRTKHQIPFHSSSFGHVSGPTTDTCLWLGQFAELTVV